MERLSPLDAAFVDAETNSQLLNIIAVLVFAPPTPELPHGYREFRDLIAERYRRIVPLRRRLHRLPTGHLAWIDERGIDIDRHLRHGIVDAPGDLQELARFTGRVAAGALPRDRPLWEGWFVEGLTGGRNATIAKIHHCAVDGVSGIGALAEFFDVVADAPRDADIAWEPEPRPGGFALAAMTARATLDWPLSFLRSARHLAGVWVKSTIGSDGGKRPPAPFTAPRLPMNRALTSRRSVAFTLVPLEDVKLIRRRFGVTVNDAVAALCAGALRRYLLPRAPIPTRPLVACVPVSERRLDDPPGGNKVSAMFYELPVGIPDRAARVDAVQRSSALAKRSYERRGSGVLEDAACLFPPRGVGWLMHGLSTVRAANTIPPFANLMISNIRGPDFPLHVGGHAIEHMFPLGPLAEGVPLNITVLSYLDHVGFGFVACPDVLPDVQELADGIRDEVDELVGNRRVPSAEDLKPAPRPRSAPNGDGVRHAPPARSAALRDGRAP